MTMIRRLAKLPVALLACLFLASTAFAGAVPEPVRLAMAPAGKPVLTVATPYGNQQFSLADLEGLGMHRVTTRTFWPKSDGTYEGPLLADVLRRAGLHDVAAVRISALDGFSQVMPGQDWRTWPILLATRRDGRPIPVRDKGPIRVIYPRDMSPQLADTTYRLRWVWLVSRIEVVADR